MKVCPRISLLWPGLTELPAAIAASWHLGQGSRDD